MNHYQNDNPLFWTDVYKMGHMEQYAPGINKVYSYLMARSGKKLPNVPFYGLQYYLRMLQAPITMRHIDEFLGEREQLLGYPATTEVFTKLMALQKLGYMPLHIKAVPEGTVVPTGNVLMTITNTHPEFGWVVGFYESLLLKVWNTCTVASYSRELRLLCERYADETCDNQFMVPYQVHDFGYRGCSSEETALLSGSAHLVNFLGTDTLPALRMIRAVYGCKGILGQSVAATEHSVMCSFGPENEFEAFLYQLGKYKKGIVSVVSDTYNLWNVLTDFTGRLKEQILARDGKVVFRPDSGDPEKIICGDPEAETGSPENKGALRLLGEAFGTTVNGKGYLELNPKVGLIYGDGFHWDRFQSVFARMKEIGFASNNLVVGIGGLLLQQHSRDVQGYAIKATYAQFQDGKCVELYKDPITDPGKKSHKGLLRLVEEAGIFRTDDQCTPSMEEGGLLQTVFLNGEITKSYTFDEVRLRSRGVTI